MRTRSRYRVLLPVILALTTVFTVGTATAETTPPSPPGDAFYVPPSPLPNGSPGDVVRWRQINVGFPRPAVKAWQVMYLSTDALGQPDVVTGTVMVPQGADPAKAPIASFAAGTEGPAFRCAPSNMIAIGALYEQPGVNDLLNSGFAVALTDYEGYRPTSRTTYVTGQSEGHAVIDVVRAASRLTETGLSDKAKVVFRGYSQGGGAAMWAGQQQPTYAPELNLVGIAAGGVPADLVQVALSLDGHKGFGLLAYSLIGLDNAYPDLKLDSYLTDTGRTEFAKLQQTSCTLELLLNYKDKKLQDYTTSSPVLTPPWLARVGENKLGGTPPKVPVFEYHATGDDLVDYSQAAALHATYCKAGANITWKTYQTDHITLVYTGNADVLQFLKDRIAGTPATSNC
ncbi:lipase family protein [Kutzneria viridogrisea]|uniref:Esterase n=1 Tax=Kutzneria viridogrisea TaxID=47990 RepID=A0ABR6BDB1_9PSEU|nr:putative esterase [Kutzneria viridogrisea]